MASDESVNSDSCIYDPNFAIVCSFFEKFSALCGIKHPAFSDLQQMLDSTEDISPELIDLHIRLMRKAKKNVNPDRWQRTLAKFCYYHSPQESWDLEQNGYNNLNFQQRLKLLLCVCEAQFDYNVKFKNDINKLPINDLRLQPIGKDKDGIMYWIHTDEKLDLKIYRENPEEETFELVVSDREGLVNLLEDLRKERDPSRKYDEEVSEEEEEEEDKEESKEESVKEETAEEEEESAEEEEDVEEEEEEEENKEKVVNEQVLPKSEPKLESQPKPSTELEKREIKPAPAEVEKPKVVQPLKSEIPEQKPPLYKHVDIKSKRFDKSPEITLKKEKVVVNTPVNMKPGEFAQHLEKLHSEKILLPLLTSPLPEKSSLKTGGIQSLKTKINLKFNMIKPVLQNEVLKSKIEDVKKNKDLLYMKSVKKEPPGKPGLKLEQILKSKLGQKLAANNPVQVVEAPPPEPVDQSSKTDSHEKLQKGDAESEKILPSDLETDDKTDGAVKRKLSSDDDNEAKKCKIDVEPPNEEEIEEPVMLVTGVGSGKECEAYPEEEEELEFVLYISGVGSGHECETGNNETEEEKEKHTPLSHNIEGMLPKNDEEPAPSTSNDERKEESEKKKPKLWTIDAICNSDSKDSKKDDISCFPNYSFNKDKKADVPYRNEFSFFNRPIETKDESKEHIIPSFYFGCDTQNPPYAVDVRNVNSVKSKSHSVKDIMETNEEMDKSEVSNYDGSLRRYEENVNHENAYNLCMPESSPQKNNVGDKSHKTENVYSDVVNLSTSNSICVNENQNESKISKETGAISSIAPSEEVKTIVNKNEKGLIGLGDTAVENLEKVDNIEEACDLTKSVEIPKNVPSPKQQITDSDALELPKEEIEVDQKVVEHKLDETHHSNLQPIAESQLKVVEQSKPIEDEPNPLEVISPEPVEAEKTDPVETEQPEATEDGKPKSVEVEEPTPAEVEKSKPVEVKAPKPVEVTEPKPVVVTETKPVEVKESKPVKVKESKHVKVKEPKLIVVTEPKPVEVKESKHVKVKEPKLVEVEKPKLVEVTKPKPVEFNEAEPAKIENRKSITKPSDIKDDEDLKLTEVEKPKSESLQITQITEPESLEIDKPTPVEDDTSKPVEKALTEIKSPKPVPETNQTSEAVKILDTPQELESASSNNLEPKVPKDVQPKQITRKSSPAPEQISPEPEPVLVSDEKKLPVTEKSLLEVEKVEASEEPKIEDELVTGKSNQFNADDDFAHSPDIPFDSEEESTETNLKDELHEEETEKRKPSDDSDNATIKKSKRVGRFSKKVEQTPTKVQKSDEEESVTDKKGKKAKSKENLEEVVTPVLRTSSRMTRSAKKEETTPKKNETPKKPVKEVKEIKTAKKGRGKKSEEETEPKTPKKKLKSEDESESLTKKTQKSEDEAESKETQLQKSEDESESEAKKAQKSEDESEPKVEKADKSENDESDTNELKPEEVQPKVTKKTRKGKRKRGKPAGKTMKIKPVESGAAKESSDEETEKQETKDEERKPIKLNIKKIVKKSDHDGEEEKVAEEPNEEEKEAEKPEKTASGRKKKVKRGWLNEIDVSNITPTTGPGVAIRQSRRIAQLKIKEQAEGKYVDQITPTKKPSKSDSKSKPGSAKKGSKSLNKKHSKTKLSKEDSDGDDSNYEKSIKKRKKKKDLKKKLKPGNPWKASSGSSTEEDDDDHFEDDEEDEDLVVNFISDHEFSPESDLEDEDFQPVKRARTAHSKPKTEDKPEKDDLCCQKCRTAEQPEWILLCDKCDEGWHASCLKPALMVIPEGDWFCPPCQHNMLICSLHKFLKTYDKNVKKRNNEELRKKRLEYVGISFSNIISEQQKAEKNDSKAKEEEEEFVKYEISDDNSEDESEEEPLYQLRIRRQANVSYRLNEYDEMMNSAIQREANGEAEEPSTEVSVAEPKSEHVAERKPSTEENEDEDDNAGDKEKDEFSDEAEQKGEEKVSPMILQLKGIRKKAARLTKLDVSSEEDRVSDEDFKGSSGDDYDDDEYGKSETDSDEARYKKSSRGPVRRSTRARVTRYDNDFINDDESDDDEYESKKKKRRSRNSDSDSEEEDSTWGKRKRSKVSRAFKPTGRRKRRRIVFDGDSDDAKKERKEKKKKSRVTYGLEESEDDYPQRRTRGKKINYSNYLENLGTDSEEDNNKSSKSKRAVSDDDDYVNEDERDSGAGVNENGEKNESGVDEDGVKQSQPTDGPNVEKPSLSNLHELIAANNTGVIRTYSKSNSERIQKPELGSDASDLDPNESSESKRNKSPKDTQIYSGVVSGDNKLVLKKVDTNPSLDGMQSMAQCLPQVLSSPSKFSVSMVQKMVPGDVQYSNVPPGHSNYADMGIKYEETEGMPPNPDHAIRVISPSKLYAGEGQPPSNMGRPPPPFLVGPGMPPGMPPGIPPGMPPNMMPRGPPPGMPLMRGPPPPPNVLPPMSQPPTTAANVAVVPVPVPNPMMDNSDSPKRRARGRGKKQLEIERMKRESLGRNDEMMPLHLLKPSSTEMNIVRPPFSAPSTGFGNYPNIPRLTYSSASGPPPVTSPNAVTVSVGNSKRVKITPTRMRMTTPQNVMRFPRAPGVLNSPHMPMDPSPSGGTAISVNNDKTSTPNTTPPPALPGKEISMKKEPQEQYYPNPYPPASQIPRGFPPRPEFAFARKPLPPMYPPPISSSGAPTFRPQTVTTNSVITGPISARISPSSIKSEPTATPYPAPYPAGSTPPNASPTSKTVSTTSPTVVITAPPSTPAYQPLHIKQLPVTPSAAPTAPFNPAYYSAPPVPNSYPQSQPPLPPGLPVPPRYPPPVSTLNQPFPVVARIPPQASFVKSPQPATSGEIPTTTSSSEYPPATQPESSFHFQECNNTPTTDEGDGQFQSNYEEESASAEEPPSGEFGGLVSYFSSQREDDLDA